MSSPTNSAPAARVDPLPSHTTGGLLPPQPMYTMPMCIAESWARLRSKHFGRLAMTLNGETEIITAAFATTDWRILIRTEQFMQPERFTPGCRVAFEVDDSNPQRAWNVVVKGRIQPEGDDGLLLAIEPTDVSGRLFQR